MLKYKILPVTAYQQNCSVVWCDETQVGTIVDPGGEVARLLQYLETTAIKLQSIWLTHGHFDHISVAQQLAAHFDIPILGPQNEDLFLFEMLPEQTQQFGFPHAEAFLPNQWLKDGDELQLGNRKFQVIHCPGHTPGHVVFVDLAAKLAWVGDVLFHGSVGRTDFPRGDHVQLLHSIQKKLLPLGDDIQFIPGHGPLSNFGHERRTNPYLVHSN